MYFHGYYYLVHQDLATLVLLLAPHQGNSWAQGLGATRAGQPLKHAQCLSDFTGLIVNHLIPHLFPVLWRLFVKILQFKTHAHNFASKFRKCTAFSHLSIVVWIYTNFFSPQVEGELTW